MKVFQKSITAFSCDFLYFTHHLRSCFLIIKSLGFMSAYAAEKRFEFSLPSFENSHLPLEFSGSATVQSCSKS